MVSVVSHSTKDLVIYSDGTKTSTLFFLFGLTGRVAALGMMGRATENKTVPYFWSAMFGKTIRYAGASDFHLSVVYVLA